MRNLRINKLINLNLWVTVSMKARIHQPMRFFLTMLKVFAQKREGILTIAERISTGVGTLVCRITFRVQRVSSRTVIQSYLYVAFKTPNPKRIGHLTVEVLLILPVLETWFIFVHVQVTEFLTRAPGTVNILKLLCHCFRHRNCLRHRRCHLRRHHLHKLRHFQRSRCQNYRPSALQECAREPMVST